MRDIFRSARYLIASSLLVVSIVGSLLITLLEWQPLTSILPPPLVMAWEQLQPLLLLLLGISGLYFLWRHERNSLSQHQIKEASERIARGDIGYQIEAQKGSVHAATEAFNSMSMDIARLYQSLKLAEGELRSTLDTVADGLVTLDLEGNILSANRAVERIFGFSSDDLCSRQIGSLMPEPYRSQSLLELKRYRARLSEGEESISSEIVGVHRNGLVFPLELRISLMQAEGEERLVMMIRDISSQLNARRETELLIDALDHCQDGFALFDASDRLIRCNQQFRALYRNCAQLLDREILYEEFIREATCLGLFPQAVGNHDAWIDQMLSGHYNPVQTHEVELAGGRWIRVHETRTGHGCTIAFHIDITQIKHTERSLESARDKAEGANRAKARFLAMMSHEIRTPLNGVLGLLDILSRSGLNEHQKEFVSAAEESGKGLLNIISDILDFSRIEAQKLLIVPESASLQPMLHNVYQLLLPQANEKGVELQLNLRVPLPEKLHFDQHRLRQVLLNLAGNAVKFTEQGFVKITVRQEQQEDDSVTLYFEVSDSGIGIPEAQQNLLFSEFTTIDSAFARRNQGAGLGLSIAAQLVRLMHGELEFSSTPGEGSRFWFSLPLRVSSEAQQLEEISHETQAQHGHLLLVEDNATNRLIAVTMLEQAGHRVDIAESGQAALAVEDIGQYDLILMDISMPDLDGIEVTRRLQRRSDGDFPVPIIAMTAHAMEGDREHFLQQGMNDYISKPVDREQLLSKIAYWLARRDSRAEAKPGLVIEPDNEVVCKTVGDEKPLQIPDAVKAEESLLSSTILAQLVKDTGEEVFPQLVEVFTQDVEERLTELKNAAASEDMKTVELQSHTLGSSSGAYGLVVMQRQARAIEKACMDGDYASALQQLEPFYVLVDESLEALKLWQPMALTGA